RRSWRRRPAASRRSRAARSRRGAAGRRGRPPSRGRAARAAASAPTAPPTRPRGPRPRSPARARPPPPPPPPAGHIPERLRSGRRESVALGQAFEAAQALGRERGGGVGVLGGPAGLAQAHLHRDPGNASNPGHGGGAQQQVPVLAEAKAG